MKYYNFFVAIRDEYSEEIALKVCIALGIQLSTKIKDSDFDSGCKDYTKRVIKKINKVFWEETKEEKELIIKLWECLYDYELTHSLQGIGGCIPKTFKELMQEKETIVS